MTDFSQPDSLLAKLLDLMADDLQETLDKAGYGPARMLVVIHCDGAPLGEPDSCVAGFGYEDSREVAAALGGHFAAALRAHGLDVKIAPLSGGPFS